MRQQLLVASLPESHDHSCQPRPLQTCPAFEQSSVLYPSDQNLQEVIISSMDSQGKPWLDHGTNPSSTIELPLIPLSTHIF